MTNYEFILQEFGEEAAKVYLERSSKKQEPPLVAEPNGEPIHDYLVEKGRL